MDSEKIINEAEVLRDKIQKMIDDFSETHGVLPEIIQDFNFNLSSSFPVGCNIRFGKLQIINKLKK